MIKKYLCTLFFAIILCTSFAQYSEEPSFNSIDTEFSRKKAILSLSLLSVLDINSPSISFGLDLKVAEWFGVHQELGYVNNWLNPAYHFVDIDASGREKNKNGLKYVLEPRFYPFDKEDLFRSRMFFAASFDFRYVNIGRNEFVERYNNSYFQKMKFKRSVRWPSFGKRTGLLM